jgi:hypothetical protein
MNLSVEQPPADDRRQTKLFLLKFNDISEEKSQVLFKRGNISGNFDPLLKSLKSYL